MKLQILDKPTTRRKVAGLTRTIRHLQSRMRAFEGMAIDFDPELCTAWLEAEKELKAAQAVGRELLKKHSVRVVVRCTRHWVHIGKMKIHVPANVTKTYTWPLKTALHVLIWNLRGQYQPTRVGRDAEKVAAYYLQCWKRRFT